jgi:hypothetical protein
MKAFIIFSTLFVLSIARADLSRKATKTSGTQKQKNIKITNIQTVNIKSSAIEKNSISLINAETEKKNAEAVTTFLNSRKLGVSDNTNSFDVNTGTTLKGIILNSVVSSNLESPILVQITESNCDIPSNAKLICTGATKGKRVLTGCTKLITNSDEFPISAILLNTDGTAGLTGEVFTGKEELVVGALVGGGLSAALDVSRDRVSTATGELATNSQRNKVITGAMGGLDEAVSIMGDEAKSKETKITVEAGKSVLIYINQRFKI